MGFFQSASPDFIINPQKFHDHPSFHPGMGSNGVTVTKFHQLLMILELYLELSYILSQLFLVVTVTEVTKVP